MSEKDAPMSAAQRLARPELPKRFYTQAAAVPVEGGFGLALDGRTARTPARRPLAVASARIADTIAAEWNAQGERIDPAAMPFTRIVNVAIDRVAEEMAPVRSEIVAHAGSDLLCYRADGPEALTAREEELWSPLVAWAREALGARFVLAEGIVHVTQNPEALAAVEEALATYDALQLAALHTVTTLTGSAIIALALAHGHISAEAAWEAAHVEEDFQMSQWGEDDLAMARRAARWREMEAAALILAEAAKT